MPGTRPPVAAGSWRSRVEQDDTELARRVRATGVSILGKTNVPEFGLLPYTEPELWGPCRNPWALDHTPGGIERRLGGGGGRRAWCRWRGAGTGRGRSGCRPRAAGCSG